MKQTFINVMAMHDPNGRVIPHYILWRDRRYDIDRVTDIRRSASTRTGGAGLRYTCFILGRERFLFYDENKWFVEEQSDGVYEA